MNTFLGVTAIFLTAMIMSIAFFSGQRTAKEFEDFKSKLSYQKINYGDSYYLIDDDGKRVKSMTFLVIAKEYVEGEKS